MTIKDYIDLERNSYKVEYSLEELPNVIDNAESWLKSVKNNSEHSGSPYFISSLQIMGV